MATLQLQPPLPLDTPLGPAVAHILIDPGIEAHLQWVCFLNENGQCWTFFNKDVRIESNFTMGRNLRKGKQK